MRILSEIYNSKFFTRAVFLVGATVGVAYLFKYPEKLSLLFKGGLSLASIILILILFFVACIVTMNTFGLIIRTYVKFKYRHEPFKFILVYPEKNEAWRKIVEVEIQPIFTDNCLTIKSKNYSSKLALENWIPFAYSINRPGVLIVETNKRFDLWKAVRKAAYGYPTKLNNLKSKIQTEIQLKK